MAKNKKSKAVRKQELKAKEEKKLPHESTYEQQPPKGSQKKASKFNPLTQWSKND